MAKSVGNILSVPLFVVRGRFLLTKSVGNILVPSLVVCGWFRRSKSLRNILHVGFSLLVVCKIFLLGKKCRDLTTLWFPLINSAWKVSLGKVTY